MGWVGLWTSDFGLGTRAGQFRRIKQQNTLFSQAICPKWPACSRDTLGSVHQASTGCCCTRHCSSPSFYPSLHRQFSQWRLDLTLVILICQLILSVLPAAAPPAVRWLTLIIPGLRSPLHRALLTLAAAHRQRASLRSEQPHVKSVNECCLGKSRHKRFIFFILDWAIILW